MFLEFSLYYSKLASCLLTNYVKTKHQSPEELGFCFHEHMATSVGSPFNNDFLALTCLLPKLLIAVT